MRIIMMGPPATEHDQQRARAESSPPRPAGLTLPLSRLPDRSRGRPRAARRRGNSSIDRPRDARRCGFRVVAASLATSLLALPRYPVSLPCKNGPFFLRVGYVREHPHVLLLETSMTTASNAPKSRPLHTEKIGALSASIWSNAASESRTFDSV